MPRGKKSKLRAREKRHHDRAQTQDLKDAQAATAEKGEATSSSSPEFSDDAFTTLVSGSLPAPLSSAATTGATEFVFCEACGEDVKRHGQKRKNRPRAFIPTTSPGEVLLTKKASLLAQYLVRQYKMNEPMRKADMLRIIHRRFRRQFPEILRKASVNVGLLFGLELKEVEPNSTSSYTLVCKSEDSGDGSLSSALKFPTRGILMPLLGVIFLCHNCLSEEDIWAVLNRWGIYDGEEHFLFGEPRKLITQDLVKEKYLEYRQVPSSDPPRFEFLWGSRAHAETSKMEVLVLLSKVEGIPLSDFQCRYEEALRDEEERARAAAATMAGAMSKASGDSRATSSH